MSNTTTTWPMLAYRHKWQHSSEENPVFQLAYDAVTEIHFVRNYTPSENVQVWAADVDHNNSITGYLEGTVVTISANGSEGIRLNPNSNAMFAGMTALQRITGLDIIDASSATQMGSTFYMCTSLKEIDLSSWDMSNVTVAPYMFSGCTALTSVKLSKYGVYFPLVLHTTVGDSNEPIDIFLFNDCSNLRHVDLGRGVKAIPDKMFFNFEKLETITGIDRVETIGTSAFEGCAKLNHVDIGANVTTIGINAFLNCTGLKTVNVGNIASWCNISFGNDYSNPRYYAESMLLNGDVLSGDLVIPENATKIPAYTFLNCTELTSVTTEANITSVGTKAFSDCYNLQRVSMGMGPERIEERTFFKCLKLESIVGFANVKYIGRRAFVYTPCLVSADINGENVTFIGESATRLSSIEDCVTFSNVDKTVEDMGTRAKRWNTTNSPSELVVFPENSIKLEVMNSESQKNYPDIKYGHGQHPSEDAPRDVYVHESGCGAFAMYHEWQCLYGNKTSFSPSEKKRPYNNFREWWNATINKTDFVAGNQMDSAVDGTLSEKMHELGLWPRTTETKVESKAQLQTIIDRLKAGKPTYIKMKSANLEFMHAVLVVGYNCFTHKLIILDSLLISPDGDENEFKFEDLFAGGSPDPYKADCIYDRQYEYQETAA